MIKQRTQKHCDALLSPLIKLKHPRCLLCGGDTQVAHHHVHKSKSLNLRYDEENLIPLCNPCHLKLHYNESYWASKVVEKKGMEWFRNLDAKKDVICAGTLKVDYNKVYDELKEKIKQEERKFTF